MVSLTSDAMLHQVSEAMLHHSTQSQGLEHQRTYLVSHINDRSRQ
jgi:hypothetical protein